MEASTNSGKIGEHEIICAVCMRCIPATIPIHRTGQKREDDRRSFKIAKVWAIALQDENEGAEYMSTLTLFR